MKIPQSWNDKSLLQDEPFQSAFCKLTTGAKVKGAHKLFTSIAHDLRKISNIDCIIEQWLELAFFGLERKKLSKLYTQCDLKDLQLFAEIQSYLARNNDVAAFKTINRQRTVRGLKPFDDVSAFEKAHAMHVEKKKKISGTRPEGPYITRQVELASQPTTKSLTGSGATNTNLQKSLRTKTFIKYPAVHSEQNKKLSRKRCADTIDSRPAKRPLISTTRPTTRPKQYCGPVKAKLPKARPSGYVPTRKNPPRPAKHHDKTTRLMDGFVEEVPEQDTVNHPDTGTAIGISLHRGLPQPDTCSSPKPFDNQPPDKRLPESSNESGGNEWGETGKVDSSNLSQDILHSPDSTIEQQSAHSDFSLEQQAQVTSSPLTDITVDILTTDDHDLTCAVQSRKYIPLYALDDSPSTALHEMFNKEDAHIVQTVPDPEPDRFFQSWQPVFEAPFLPVKRPLPFYPPIWAQSRQEVCETFDWFRSYQGGVYHSNEMVKGYLLSGFPSSRDRFEHEGRLIISHGGGRAESIHSNKGQMASHQATDQLAQDKSIRALLNNHRYGRPLALLIDDKYALFPYDIGIKDITYAVLGFYTIAHVWAEYQPANNELGRVVRYKFAFRWCEDQGSPWWLKEDDKPDTVLDNSCPKYENPVPVHLEDSCNLSSTEKLADSDTDSGRHPVQQDPLSATKILCTYCCNYSPKIFLRQWTCLIPECIMFWKQAQGELHGQFINELTYDPQFLALPPHKPLPYGYQDAVKSLSKRDVTVDSLRNYHITRGYHCNICGRLSCRFQWEKWECSHCLSFLNIFVPIHLAQDIWNQALPMPYRDYNVNPISEIVSITSGTFTHDAGRGIITSFVLPYYRGKIHLIQTTNPRGREEADNIFLDYQTQAATGILKFRRWPLRAHKCRGPLLTNYFSHNAGKPYKYVAGDANTVPFDSAPAVCAARALIMKRIRQALNIQTQFNEVLSAAYMERQRMAFHSDNEVGLGPVVAGLSLGSPALMHFRLHARFDPEREKRGIMLSIVLRHGDVLVMDGAGIQEYYEHTVVPNNFRIAATARQIGATHS